MQKIDHEPKKKADVIFILIPDTNTTIVYTNVTGVFA
jgi:ketol-acid reductoisomerase